MCTIQILTNKSCSKTFNKIFLWSIFPVKKIPESNWRSAIKRKLFLEFPQKNWLELPLEMLLEQKLC